MNQDVRKLKGQINILQNTLKKAENLERMNNAEKNLSRSRNLY